MKRHLRQRGIRLLLATTVLLAVAAGIAYAAIPDSNGVIRGCYQASSGALRVIGSNPTVGGGKCSAGEKALNWNQRGPTGAKGATGANGKIRPKPGRNCAACKPTRRVRSSGERETSRSIYHGYRSSSLRFALP